MTGPIPKSFIQSLLAQCDIVEIIDSCLPLKKRGKNYVACCPFHQENTPSFTVSSDKQLYHCFGCGEAGNVISFIMAYERLDFVETIASLANRLGLTVPREGKQGPTPPEANLHHVMEQAMLFYKQQLVTCTKAQDYLAQRGISKTTIAQFNLGFAPASWTALFQTLSLKEAYSPAVLQAAGLIIEKTKGRYYDRFRDRIIFPIRDRRGRCIGFGGRSLSNDHKPKYLNSPETTIFFKSRELYGLYEACQQHRQFERIWVVEGYLDVLTLAQCPTLSQVVATLGTSTSTTHLQRLFGLTQELVFCFDGDAAGLKAAWHALETCLPILQDGWILRFVLLPEGEDPDSWVQKADHAPLEKLLLQALSLEDFFFKYLQASLDISTPEGKGRLAREAFSRLNKIPPTIIRHHLLERLAHRVGVQVEALQQLIQKAPTHIAPSQSASKGMQSPLHRALAYLLQHPHLAQTFSDLLQELSEIDYPLLLEIFHLILKRPTINTGSLLEHFRTHKAYELLVSLAQHTWLIPESGIPQEFKDTLEHLQKRANEHLIEKLLEKARNSPLSNEEKHQLQCLINKHHK